MCEDNVKLADHVDHCKAARPIVGKDQICEYYNRLLNKAWGVGCKMSWRPIKFAPGEENGTVVADYDVTLIHPTGKETRTRHVDTFKLSSDRKIADIQFKADPVAPALPTTGLPDAAPNNFVVEKFATAKPPPDFRIAHTAASQGLPDDARSFIYHGWQAWTRAMANGWIGEWILAFCTKDVVFRDHHNWGKGKVKDLCGIPEVVSYYNKMLHVVWGIGSSVQWKARSFTETTPSSVVAEFDITVRTMKDVVKHSRQKYEYKLDGRRICEVVILPEKPQPTPGSPKAAPAPDRVVLLVRPCGHNSWDNVRIKRGWLVLRCRLCHGQWRQRPVEIKRCAEFSENKCDKGVNCPALHIHHIKHTKSQREQVKDEFDRALEFLRTTEGVAVVGALAVLSFASTSARPRRRTNTCPH
eukprot:TRINITY_DN8272_c0_g1_i2.p1 TRINITY_DN8272_c0_g1~~TRINITY_DN8272_c0_g1_i2.p1  ORF type:complete len:442 (+),score=51.45 TRINITY_DN8272_c0_g1_i2:90-1328(+)